MKQKKGKEAKLASVHSLISKKDLIVHTYDVFLIAQTRLFALATSRKESDSDEISRKQELLLLDDLMMFAISARRLIELTRSRDFAAKIKIPLVYLDQREEPYVVGKLDVSVDFVQLVNKLIHALFIQFINKKHELVSIFVRATEEARMQILLRRITEKKVDEIIEPLLLIESDKGDPILVSLQDIITKSSDVAEQIIEECAKEHIFLELYLRGAD